MENVTLMVFDFIALTLGISLLVGVLCGIVGLVMRILNKKRIENGQSVSKNRRQYADAFFLLGEVSLALIVVLVVLYFVIIK
ncbi:MAG: hypothetical protein KBT02_13610 [Treponema sp.]|nr:hypothetical protein [Candidatus Treponema caballi]